MKNGVKPNTENRYKLLKIYREKGMTAKEFRNLIEPMRDKSNDEKEQIAKSLIEEV